MERVFNWRDTRYKRFYSIIDEVVLEIQEHTWKKTNRRKRKLRAEALERLTYSVECLIKDCVAVVFQRKRKGEASVHLGQHHYPANREDKNLTYKIHVQRAYYGLLELGYIQVTKRGFYKRTNVLEESTKSKLTRYVATDKLLNLFTTDEQYALPAILPGKIDEEPIKIKVKIIDDKGNMRRISQKVPENKAVQKMRKNLRIINNVLSRRWYDLDITDEKLSELQSRLAIDKENERNLRFDHRSMFRVFNDCDLETGGRFYGGWWQNIPKEYRHSILIDGKQTVEVDFSNQHPSILYAWRARDKPNDCYSEVLIPRTLKNGTSALDLRKMVKRAFNAMLNSSKVLKNAPNGVKPKEFGLTWQDVSEAIIEFHKPIHDYFYTGIGLRLQRIDSDIAEQVLLHFANLGIPILPLHDSFIIHHGDEEFLKSVMRKAFSDIVGVVPKVDTKVKLSPTSASKVQGLDEPTTLSLSEILENEQLHSKRLDAFRSILYRR